MQALVLQPRHGIHIAMELLRGTDKIVPPVGFHLDRNREIRKIPQRAGTVH